MAEAISRNEVKRIWKSIDRKLKQTTVDSEISGKPNNALTVMDLTPLELPDDQFSALGALTANNIAMLQEQWEKEKIDRIKRYKKLQGAQEHPEIDGALKIYADEATTEDQDGIIIHVNHPNNLVKETIEDMIERLGLDEKAWSIIKEMSGFGDSFYEIIVARSARSILKINKLPKEAVERIEENGILQGFRINNDNLDAQDNFQYELTYQSIHEEKDELIYPFRILHFKIDSDKYGVNGESVIDSIVGTIEQLKMMEKALVVARVTRAPERRVFTIDVGNLSGEKAVKYARMVVDNFKSRKKMSFYSNPNQQIDLQKDIFGTIEDLVIPKRMGSEGNQISTLEQANNLGDVADIEFLRDKIFPSIGIPRQYFYDDSFANSNTNLSSKSVPFAKKIRRIQRFFLKQIYKLAIIELKLQGFSNEEISQLTILMNNPSNIDDRERIAVENERWGLISTIKGLNTEKTFYPDYLIYQDFLKMNKDEIAMVLRLNMMQDNGQNPFEIFDIKERPVGAEDIQIAGGPGGAEGGGGMGGGGMGGELGGEIGGGEGGTGGEGGEEIPEEIEETLGPPPEEGGEESGKETPENASADVYDATKKSYIESTIEKKRKLLEKFTNSISTKNEEEKVKEEEKYTKIMHRAKRISFAEIFINGELMGMDKVHTKIEIYDEEILDEISPY